MLRVLRCKVKANGNIYVVGETLPRLPIKDEKRLLESGIVEEIAVETSEIEPVNELPETVDEEQEIKEVNEDSDSDTEVNELPETVNISLNLDDLDDVVVNEKVQKSKNKSRK